MKSFNPWTLLQVWCHVAPLAMVQAAPRPDPVPGPEASAAAQPAPEPKMIPAVPLAMAWLGSIGGVLGIISFTESYITRMVEAIKKATNPHHDKDKGDPPWVVGVQVGLDGHGLNGAGGDFPQFCLWNNHGQLLGYNDQTIHLDNIYWGSDTHPWYVHPGENPRPKNMPYIASGGLQSLGIWPASDEHSLGDNQAVYVTMFKRHFNPICIASVYVQWPDQSRWVFDGTWARASNMSWYFSYVYDSDSRQQECFWLDHTGSLKGEEVDWIYKSIRESGKGPKTYLPLWTSPKGPDWVVPPNLKRDNIIPEAGIPEGDHLTEGMRENGVADYKVPMGVKWHVPALRAGNYGDNIDNLTIDDFALNPAKMRWITSPSRRSVRGGNPVLPILHPQTKLSEKNPDLIWEDEYNQHIPDHCLTDWYYDARDWWIPPGSGGRCIFSRGKGDKVYCRDGHMPVESRAIDDSAVKPPGPPLHERYARTLINDKNKRGGSGTKELCESPHSVGPSYANHQERVFCRMTDKTLWPFCDSTTRQDCFDAEAEVLVEKNQPVGKRMLHWDIIEDWHSNERFRRAA